MPFFTPFTLTNGQKYLFCILNGSDELRLGYDVQIDYESTVDNYLQPIAPVKVLPNGQAQQWYWAGFGLDATPSISVTMDNLTGVIVADNPSNLYPFPNPAINFITIPNKHNQWGNVNITLFDLAGKLILTDNVNSNETIKLNAASIQNGTYLIMMLFENGEKNEFKISISR